MGSAASTKIKNKKKVQHQLDDNVVAYDNLTAPPSLFQTPPLYYRSQENEYIIIITTAIQQYNINNNQWSLLSRLPAAIQGRLSTQHCGNTINRATNTLYIMGGDQNIFASYNLEYDASDVISYLVMGEAAWFVSDGRQICLKELMFTQSVYVSSLNELHVFGSDNARSYHLILDETGINGDEFNEAEGINDNVALINAKMIHVKYKDELMIFGGVRVEPFQRHKICNQTIFRYKLSGNGKWEINETDLPFKFGQQTFEVVIGYECIVVVYIQSYDRKNSFWFWDLIRNKWYESNKQIPDQYTNIIITDYNIIHCIANSFDQNQRKHIRFRLLDIMPSNLHENIKQSFCDLVYKYIDLHFGNKVPIEIIDIILRFFELF